MLVSSIWSDLTETQTAIRGTGLRRAALPNSRCVFQHLRLALCIVMPALGADVRTSTENSVACPSINVKVTLFIFCEDTEHEDDRENSPWGPAGPLVFTDSATIPEQRSHSSRRFCFVLNFKKKSQIRKHLKYGVYCPRCHGNL